MPAIRTEVKIFALSCLGLAFAVGYFTRFPLPDFFLKGFHLAAAFLVAFSAFGWGARMMKLVRVPPLSAAEQSLFATVLGFGLTSLWMFGLGVVGAWSREPILVLLVVGIVFGWLDRGVLVQMMASWKTPAESAIPLTLVSLSSFLSFLIAFAPPTYYDTLVYHYALPQAYLYAEGWVGNPELIYSAFPQTLELLWTLGMALLNDTLANLIGWILSMLGIGAVYLFTERFASARTAAWAAALLSGMPTYMLLSSGGYVDVGLAVFAFTSFYALYIWAESNQPGLLILAGALSGFAVGCKYTGALTIVIGALFVTKESIARTYQNHYKSIILYVSVSALLVLPWLLKNMHYVGNPVFPFLYKRGFDGSPWVQGAAEGYFRGLTEYTPRSIFGLGKLLWEIAVGGLQFGGGMDMLGDLGWGLLFGLLPALWFAKKLPFAIHQCLIYALLFFIPWALSRPVLRFLVPIAPFLAILSAYSYTQVIEKMPAFFRRGGSVLVGLLLISNAALFFEASSSLALFAVPVRSVDRDIFLARRLKYYRAAQVLKTLPSDSRTFVIGDQCSYYYNSRVFVAPVFNTNPLTEWANGARSGRDLAAKLRSEGITHLLINHTELARLNPVYHILPLSERGNANWDDLRNRAKSLYRDAHCEVLSLS